VYQDWRNPLKIAMIGCGRPAHSYIAAIDNHPAMVLSAVVDSDPETARKLSHSFNCPYYTSLDDYMCGDHFSSCSVICTTPSKLADIAIPLMQNGASVLCDNPFALDYASVEKMLDVSRTFGVRLMAGSRFRYITDIIQARGLVQSGMLGRVLVFEIDFRDFSEKDRHAGFWPDRKNHGVLVDKGNHAFDIARYFFGPLQRVRAEETQKFHSHDYEDTVRLDMRTVSGVIGTAQLSWTLKNLREDYIRIYGTRGTLCIGWKDSKYRLHGFADWIPFGEGYNTLKAVTRQMENLLHTIKENGIPETTTEDGSESVRALESAYRSLLTGRWIDLSAEAVPKRIERNFRVLRPAFSAK